MILNQLVFIKRRIYAVIAYNIRVINFLYKIDKINARIIKNENYKLYLNFKIYNII